MLHLVCLSLQLALPVPPLPPSLLADAPVANAAAFPTLPQPAQEADLDPALARGTKRILRLADGRTLQAVARLGKDGWEVKRGRKYQALPQGSVVDAATEKQVLAQWQRSAKEGAAQAAWVRQGFQLGLRTQSLTALEKLLVDEPGASEPVALVAEFAGAVQRPRVELDADPAGVGAEQLEAVAKWGASRGPLAAELAILELARCRDRHVLQERLAAWLEQGSPERRAFAAHGLRRLAPRARPKPLMRRAVLDGSETVREQAALALAAAGDEALSLPLVRALGSSHPTIRSRAAQSLGLMGYTAAVPALVTRLAAAARGEGGGHAVPHAHIFVGTQSAYVQDFDVEVAAGASIADPSVNTLVSGSVLDVGVRGIGIQRTLQAERGVLVNSLRQLTGADPGRRAKDWSAWYERNRSRFEGSPEGAGTRTPR